MELKNVEAFLMIAEKGSFSEAAEALNITQPTISIRIKQLETKYNTILFKRINGKKITLTDIGTEVYSYLKEAYTLLQKAENILTNLEKKLTISTTNYMGLHIIPELLQVLYQSYPNMEINVQIEDTKRMFQLVKSGDINLGLGYIFSDKDLEDQNLKFIKIIDEENVLVCSPNHPLASKKIVYKEDLFNEKIVIFNCSKFFSTSNIESFLSSKGIKINKKLEINNLDWLKMMVSKEVGITVLQKMIVEEELRSGKLVKLNIPVSLPTTPVYLIFNPNLSKEIMDLVTLTIKRIFQQHETIVSV